MPASAPAVSVIVPAHNGAGSLDRTLESLAEQTLPNWEAIAVDDGSTDATAEILAGWAVADPRIRVLRHSEARGPAAARNTALAAARAEWIAYLDCGDEFFPDHLARVHSHRDQGDVLLFRYDLVEERPDHPQFGRTVLCDPAARFREWERESIAAPLGVAHRRNLLARVGYFDESLGFERPADEGAELWRRFAKAGAKFAGVAAKSGLRHRRTGNRTRIGSEAGPSPAPDGVREVDVVRGTERHTLTMPGRDAWIVDQIFRDGEYAGIPLAELAAPPTILDVGAHCGTFAVYAKAAIHRDARIHCFEPYPRHVEFLKRNTAGFAGITVHDCGLGGADAIAELLLHPRWGVGHSLLPALVPEPVGRVPVRIRDARAVWNELGLDGVDILKLDAEGAEVEILERLAPHLHRVRVALVEYHTAADRRRIDALLPGHSLFGAAIHSTRVGTLKYLRADLAGG